MPFALTIAGSDNTCGAGIQADINTMLSLGISPLCVITAITSQNSCGVKNIYPLPYNVVKEQLLCIAEDVVFDFFKTGMLFDEKNIELVSEFIDKYNKKLILDTVILSKNKKELLSKKAIEYLKKFLIPKAFLVTPNIDEVEILTGIRINSQKDYDEAAQAFFSIGAKNIFIKGGHLNSSKAIDILYLQNGQKYLFEKDKINNPNTHGTGCILSAAITSYLAKGYNLIESTRLAKEYLYYAIKYAEKKGKCIGSPNLFMAQMKKYEKAILREELLKGFEMLKEKNIASLIPEIQSNFCACMHSPQSLSEIMGFPGRIVKVKNTITYVNLPEYGASKHIAKILKTVNSFDNRYKAVMNIKYLENIEEIAKKLNFKIGFFDRRNEPKEIKEKEGYSLEWGTKKVLDELGYVPDLIYDKGDIGKEPIVRVIGFNPIDVANKIIKIKEYLDERKV